MKCRFIFNFRSTHNVGNPFDGLSKSFGCEMSLSDSGKGLKGPISRPGGSARANKCHYHATLAPRHCQWHLIPKDAFRSRSFSCWRYCERNSLARNRKNIFHGRGKMGKSAFFSRYFLFWKLEKWKLKLWKSLANSRHASAKLLFPGDHNEPTFVALCQKQKSD